jgi:hypothetical protein
VLGGDADAHLTTRSCVQSCDHRSHLDGFRPGSENDKDFVHLVPVGLDERKSGRSQPFQSFRSQWEVFWGGRSFSKFAELSFRMESSTAASAPAISRLPTFAWVVVSALRMMIIELRNSMESTQPAVSCFGVAEGGKNPLNSCSSVLDCFQCWKFTRSVNSLKKAVVDGRVGIPFGTHLATAFLPGQGLDGAFIGFGYSHAIVSIS